MLLEISSQYFQVSNVREKVLEILDVDSVVKPHVVMVMGKGGVGKTTISIMLALIASSKFKTLIMSIDPAMHLIQYLGIMDVKGKIVNVKGNLWAYQLDLESTIRSLTESYAIHIRDLLPSLKVLNLDDVVDIVKNVPGLEEEVYMRSIHEATTMNFEFIIVDTPPTGITLRILTLPKLYTLWLERLIELRERIVALRYVIARTLYGEKEIKDRALEKLYKLREYYSTLEKLYTSQQHSSFILVSNPEPVPYMETLNTIKHITQNLNRKPKLLVMNKVLPEYEAKILNMKSIQEDILRNFCTLEAPKVVIMKTPKPPSTLTDIADLIDKINTDYCLEIQ